MSIDQCGGPIDTDNFDTDNFDVVIVGAARPV